MNGLLRRRQDRGIDAQEHLAGRSKAKGFRHPDAPVLSVESRSRTFDGRHTTVDRSFVLATPHFDKHTTYVSMSRHRDDVTLCYSKDNFKDFKELQDLCGRERPKHLVAYFAMPRGFESQDTALAPEKDRIQILGYYTRNVERLVDVEEDYQASISLLCRDSTKNWVAKDENHSAQATH
jgi:hypothetical protein